MKVSIKNVVARVAMFIVFVLFQVQAWADTGSDIEQSRWSIVASKPEFWVGAVLFIGFMVAGTILGKRNREPEVE